MDRVSHNNAVGVVGMIRKSVAGGHLFWVTGDDDAEGVSGGSDRGDVDGLCTYLVLVEQVKNHKMKG